MEAVKPPAELAHFGRLHLRVMDEKGAVIPFRAQWHVPCMGIGGRPQRHWCDNGEATLELPAGPVSMLVRRGINYDAVAMDLTIAAGELLTRDVVLRQRFDPRAMGWWGGENHMHVLHARNDPPATFADGARLAAADGLDYIQLAYGWDQEMDWPPAEVLDRRARQASNSHVVVGWNIESPKSYMGPDDGGANGNLYCFGHGWTVGLKDNARGHAFFHSGPNFHVIQEVARQGGVVGAAHPVRFWFASNGNFVSNWNSELPFDFVGGAPYAAIDILNDSPLLFFESEHLWYTLLNLGYKVSGTGNSDGAVGTTRGVGLYRTYARIAGEFSWDKLVAALRSGEVVATSGPFVLFSVDGQDPGAEFISDGKPHRASLRAWSSPLPGETLVAVQLVRNGAVVRAWDLREQELREWQVEFDLSDREFAWYCVRVVSSCRDPHSIQLWGHAVCELAVASPVYFLPSDFARPKPAVAHLQLDVKDEWGRPVPASVQARDNQADVCLRTLPADGVATLNIPATASLVINAPGFASAERNLFLDCPGLLEYCRNIATVWPSIYSPDTYAALRQRLANLRLSVVLKPEPAGPGDQR